MAWWWTGKRLSSLPCRLFIHKQLAKESDLVSWPVWSHWYPLSLPDITTRHAYGPRSCLDSPCGSNNACPPSRLAPGDRDGHTHVWSVIYVEVVHFIVSAIAGRPCNTRHPPVPRPYPLTVILACHVCDQPRVRSGSIIFSRLLFNAPSSSSQDSGPRMQIKKSLYRHHMHSTGMIVSYTRLLTTAFHLPYNRGER